MDEKTQHLVEAVEKAQGAEADAKQFYLDAREKATDPRGKDLLGQLADFEQRHFEKLGELKASLTGGAVFTPYEGTSFKSTPPRPEGGATAEKALEGVLDILTVAIEAETKAGETYRNLAGASDVPEVKDMFTRLADEEMLHRRILSDEFYQLSNRGGVWTWGD